MQLSFRLDKRPCESHLALDGKKWSLADRSKTQSKYKVKREKPVQQAEQNSVETKRSRGTSSDQTCVPSHAKQNKPTSTNNSRNAPEPKHKPQNNLPPHWKNTGRQQRGISWSSITRTWDGGMWSHRWRLFFSLRYGRRRSEARSLHECKQVKRTMKSSMALNFSDDLGETSFPALKVAKVHFLTSWTI